MGLFKSRRPGTGPGTSTRKERAADQSAILEFVGSRRGVEAYLEPRTSVTRTTVVFVANDGEWIRKPFDSPKAAADFARKHRLPLYDTNQVGYPQRMRDWNTRRSGTTTTSRRPPSPTTPAPVNRRSGAERTAVRELQFLAEVPVTDGEVDDAEAKRLVRAARAKVHPDRTGGDRTGWDRADRAARVLGLD